MPKVLLTNRLLNTLNSDTKPYFLGDDSLQDFGVKVNQNGAGTNLF